MAWSISQRTLEKESKRGVDMAKTVRPLSSEEQLNLRNKAKMELERLEAVYLDEDISEKINKFKEKFGVCEIVYKVILEEHQFNKTGRRSERLKVDMKQAPYALDYAGYDFDKNLLTHLFGAKVKVGFRTVKKLRDSLTHSVNPKAVEELINREVELHSYMDQFLLKIRNFDVVS